ncbi:MAG: VWA domain-containing protein [Gemmatimonadetes bacterium]|nr:VWA domain-containing protein [Gemmatimonadota bacterium]
MGLEHPELVWTIAALLLASVAVVWRWRARRGAAVRALGSPGLLQRLSRADLAGCAGRRALLVAGAGAAIGFALAGPQWGVRIVEAETRGLEGVLVLDISASMLARDVLPSRLERERTETRRLLRELPGDRVGLVVFAGRAYVLTPLTSDHGAVELFLDALDPEVAGTPGTSIASAVRQATDLFRSPRSAADKVIVLFSDGEAHEPDDAILSAGRRAAQAGIRIYTVGVGTERGEPIPEYDPESGRVAGYRRDGNGEIVLSRLSPAVLQRLASVTDGAFVRADAGGVARLVEALESLQRASGPGLRRLELTPRDHWFALLGFLLLAIDAVLGSARLRW